MQATQIDAENPPPVNPTEPYGRNVLLLPPRLLQMPRNPDQVPKGGYGVGGWGFREVFNGLQQLGFRSTPAKTSLSVLVVEMLPLNLPVGLELARGRAVGNVDNVLLHQW